MHTRQSKTIFYVIEGLNALGSSYFNSYVFFLLRDRFGFGNLGNLSVSAVVGFVYVFAAWQGGRFAQRFGYYTALKTGFGGLAACLAAGALVPSLATTLLVVVGWTATVCFTWPALEALVSDGATSDVLPRNIGFYNFVWSLAAAVIYGVGGALYETLGHDSIFWLPAIIYGGLCLIVVGLGKNPVPAAGLMKTGTGAATNSGSDRAMIQAVAEPVPVFIRQSAAISPSVSPQTFLRTVWLAIPFSYVGITTVIAVIPSLAKTLELSTAQAGLFCSVWMFVRMGTFVVLWHWSGWHYRLRWLVGAFVGLIVGFSLLLLSHGIGVLVAAQTLFGVSVGLMYYSSLFYSMDVGETQGEHGGVHEAMIGTGMCLGPAIGALSLYLAPDVLNAGAYAVAALLACGLVGMIGMCVRRAA